MKQGFMYLMAVMDWWSRHVLAWELSNTLEAAFCFRTWQVALARGTQPPLISNTDKGSSPPPSMSGPWMDNRFVRRLWRSLRYEDIYLRGYENGLALRRGVGIWFGDYNDWRPHQAVGHATPSEVYNAPESHADRFCRQKTCAPQATTGRVCLKRSFSFFRRVKIKEKHLDAPKNHAAFISSFVRGNDFSR